MVRWFEFTGWVIDYGDVVMVRWDRGDAELGVLW
jgi:hypothetical protein